MNSHSEDKGLNILYPGILILSETLKWLNLYELIILLNEYYNNWHNNLFKTSVSKFLASVFILTHLASVFLMKRIKDNKGYGFTLNSFYAYTYMGFASISHVIFACSFCKLQTFNIPFNISLENVTMLFYFYCTTFVCLLLRIIMLWRTAKYKNFYGRFGSFHIYLLLSIVLLASRMLYLQIDVKFADFFVLNYFMLLYFAFLLENIYVTTNSKAIVFKVLYVISIIIMFIPTITNSLKLVNMLV